MAQHNYKKQSSLENLDNALKLLLKMEIKYTVKVNPIFFSTAKICCHYQSSRNYSFFF